ncbi:MAG: alpha/beta fold hydrolase [Candidatus Omnitrophota bacterium]|jgi:alpha-beta hydrolase superfamily lysophospholipase
MKKLYIIVFALLALSIVIFLSSFIYLDKNKHKVYYYTVSYAGHDVGTIRIDKFVTEDKFIYKSIASMPYDEMPTESRTRMTFGRKFDLESYVMDSSPNGAAEFVYLETAGNTASYISRYNSKFAIAKDVPITRDTLIFDEGLPITYLPVIENYNFKIGKSQGFGTLVFFGRSELPPMKRYLMLTSIKNEYLKIGRRKIKTENLIFKTKNCPQGSIWVAKSDRSLIAIDLPGRGLKVTRSFSAPKALTPAPYMPKSDAYTSRDVVFNNDKVRLSGTLTVPNGDGKFPAVLLVWGDGPEDRNYRGLFSSTADYLSANGYCVLRFDKRGIGSSDGNPDAYAESDCIDDLGKALECLAGQKEVDADRIAVLGHARGAFYALKTAGSLPTVKALVLLAPQVYLKSAETYFVDNKNWSASYCELVSKAVEETRQKALSAKGNWIYILWRRCFAKKLKEEIADNVDEVAKNIKIPVMILQGKEDKIVPMEWASNIDKILSDSGNTSHILTYCEYLGNFFGKIINDGTHGLRHEADKEALGNILGWLNKALAEPDKKIDLT